MTQALSHKIQGLCLKSSFIQQVFEGSRESSSQMVLIRVAPGATAGGKHTAICPVPIPPMLPSQCHPCHPQQVRVGSDALHSLSISINNKAISIKLHFTVHPGCLLQTVANAVTF